MALSNFLLTVLGVGAVWMIVRTDLRQSSAVFSRNVRHLRNWLEKEAASSSEAAERLKPKELEKTPVEKSAPPKDDKH
eukprot:c14089_g1_i1 orf=292-525(+)